MAKRFASLDPSQFTMIVGGLPISGFPDGVFINIEYDEDHFNKESGIDLTTRVATGNYDASITITLQQTSASNDILSSFAELDRRGVGGVVPVLFRDSGGRTTMASDTAWVRRTPAAAFASGEGQNREWVLDVVDLVGLLGGNEALL